MKITRRRLLSSGLSIGSVLALASMGVTIPEVKAKEVIETSIEKIDNRRLLDYIQKIMADAMDQVMFEENDFVTRKNVRQMINKRLFDLRSSQVIRDFRVVSDETNNTQNIIDNNELCVDVYVKLNKSISFYNISGSMVRTGVEFNEAVGLAA